jgi:hypothetical protein
MTSPNVEPTGPAAVHREQYFKTDHLRPIDHYIDYFGDGGATKVAPPDPGPEVPKLTRP